MAMPRSPIAPVAIADDRAIRSFSCQASGPVDVRFAPGLAPSRLEARSLRQMLQEGKLSTIIGSIANHTSFNRPPYQKRGRPPYQKRGRPPIRRDDVKYES